MGGPFKENLWWRKGGRGNAILLHNIWTCSKQCSVVILRKILSSDKEGKCMNQPHQCTVLAGLKSNGPIVDQLPVIRQRERGETITTNNTFAGDGGIQDV
jgi:hypothetical protein